MNARPTTIRLDQPTLDRAATLRDAQRVPVSLSAVLQEAIRRGLDALESDCVGDDVCVRSPSADVRAH